MTKIAYDHLLETASILAMIDRQSLFDTVKALEKARADSKTVFTMGNGGSHATASHFANDLYKVCCIKAVCASDHTPLTYAYMNDIGPGAMFWRPIREFIGKNDVIIAFSCSGNSENVVNALRNAPESVKKVLFTGASGGSAANLADITLFIPHKDIKIQESCHSVICHAVTEALDGEKM
jgi:D-sedoheptulose 7-phosphate isomerase